MSPVVIFGEFIYHISLIYTASVHVYVPVITFN